MKMPVCHLLSGNFCLTCMFQIVKKLAGEAKGTAAWCTNIGNEDGQVLMSVLTCEEGYGGLGPMVDGIVNRYATAGIDPPKVLYVDRDCCGNSFTERLFSAWPHLFIRLDIWHFMRRFTAGCSTDAHQLYGVFMSRLSKCIFEWSSEDLRLLRDAKRSELKMRRVTNPSADDIVRWLTKNELALHCRRRTRGTEETTRQLGRFSMIVIFVTVMKIMYVCSLCSCNCLLCLLDFIFRVTLRDLHG